MSPATVGQTCVAGILASNPTTIYNIANGTVTDTRNGLMWDQCLWGVSGPACATGSPNKSTWQQALSLSTTANAIRHRGYSDWRLPNVKELSSLVETCQFNPSINSEVFPSTPGTYFWSSSPDAYDGGVAWAVGFGSGNAHNYISRDYPYWVRLVRAGQ